MKSIGLTCGAIALLSVTAVAQSFAQAPVALGTVPVPLSCRDFKKNEDGSWSPIRSIALGNVTLLPANHYKVGDVLAGLPLPEMLNKQCVRH